MGKNDDFTLVTFMAGVMMMLVLREHREFPSSGSFKSPRECSCEDTNSPAPASVIKIAPPAVPTQKKKNIAAQANLLRIKKSLDEAGYILIPGPMMKTILKKLGATDQDLQVLESGQVHRHLPPDQQPVMHHRLNSCHRVIFNTSSGDIATADTHAVTQYPSTEIASDFSDGAKIAYKRSETDTI